MHHGVRGEPSAELSQARFHLLVRLSERLKDERRRWGLYAGRARMVLAGSPRRGRMTPMGKRILLERSPYEAIQALGLDDRQDGPPDKSSLVKFMRGNLERAG